MGELRAAAGKVDLEPVVGRWMSGFASRLGPAEGIHDAIMARAVLLDDGATKLAIVACDVVGFSAGCVADMRRRIAGRTAIRKGNVLICCTHTHSGPTSLPMRGVIGKLSKQWLARAESKIVELVCGLAGTLAPARFAHASTTISGVGFNRQDQTRPNDEELIAISIEGADGSPIATLVNYATHAVVLGGHYMQYSADFPGVVCSEVEKALGGVGIYLQGACGDVNPLVEMRGNYADCERVGKTLAGAAVKALSGVQRTKGVKLAVGSKLVDVPLDPPPTLDELAARKQDLIEKRDMAAEAGDRVNELLNVAMLDWAGELEALIEAGSVPKSVPAEVFAAGIDDLRLVGLPFETYTDIGLGIKAGMRPLKAAFVGYANGVFGYCPTRWAKDQGGYGPAGSYYWFEALVTPIGYGADELLIKAGVKLARSI